MNKKLLALRLCLLMAVLLVPLAAAAQGVVAGRVFDSADRQPIPGVSVLVKGTQTGTITDADGNFSLTLAGPGQTLVFSFIGYATQEFTPPPPSQSRESLSIYLVSHAEELNDVVVVGYGVQKKSSVTASVVTVPTEEIQKTVTSNVASALQGRAPGVEVLQNGAEAGGDISIVVRGAGSFGSTEPLYIIDGAVGLNGLNSINPNDIASIEILKDGSAAAIYGSRAANGVVLVTTKSGKSGRTNVEVGGNWSWQTISKKLDFMNADEWRQFANMVADNSSSFERADQNVSPTNPGYSQDWQDLYYRGAPMWSLNASLSGGGQSNTFSASLGYTKQEGIVIETDYEKYNARINSTFDIGRFHISENVSLAHTKKQAVSPQGRMVQIPTIPVKDGRGRYVSTPQELNYSLLKSNITNPLALIYNRDSWTRKTDIVGSAGLVVDLVAGLKYKLNLAGSYLNSHGYTHTPEYASYWDAGGTPDSRFSQPYTSLSESRGEEFDYTIDNLLTFNGEFAGHEFDVLAGTSWMREFHRTMSISSGVADLGSAAVTTFNGEGTVTSAENNAALFSFLGRLNYAFRSRYLLSASIRSDKSSKFASGYRVGWFPSVSVGWNVHNEGFFNLSWIQRLKLRASYGEMGANFIDPYSFLNLAYGPVPAIFGSGGGSRQNGYVTRLAQPDLTWETAVSKNVGVEFGFIDNSLTFEVEWFSKENRDLLAPLEPLPSSGQTIIINDGDVPYYNTASVENKGWELTAGYRRAWSDWSVDVSANISFLDNEVKALGDGVQPIRGNMLSDKFNDRPSITMAGLPIGSFWGYKVLGVNPETGDFIFQGADGSAKAPSDVSDDDKRVIGNPIPDFTYGINVNLGWKSWDLTAFFQGTHGNDIFAAGKYFMYFDYDTNTLRDAMSGSWTAANRSATLPIAKTDNRNGGNALPSSFYVEDGSYFRCKNLQLGYSFPQMGFVQSARLYVGVTNLFTITDYSLYDPEVSSNTLFDRGLDGLQNNAPTVNSRTFNVGLSVKL